MAASPSLSSSFQSVPAQPSHVAYPAVSYAYEPGNGRVYSRPQTHPAGPTPGVSSDSRNTAVSWDPVPGPETSHSVSRISQSSKAGALPPPPLYVGGELERYEQSLEHGNSETETEEQSFMPPPPPPGPYPQPVFQAGELSKYASIFEHGNEERETEEQGFGPYYSSASQTAQELPVPSAAQGVVNPVPQQYGPNMHYLFLTGQLPPGTLSHFQSDYETGGHSQDEVHYERYYPVAQQPSSSPQMQEAPRKLWQWPQYYSKSN